MFNKGFFICFTGIDGSGKTINSKFLVQYLLENGINCEYVYGRLDPFLLKPFIWIGRKLFLKKQNMFDNYSKYAKKKRESIKKHNLLTSFYYKIMLFDYITQIFFKFNVPLIFGKNIICDRYIFDTAIIDISVDLNYSLIETKNYLEKCFKIIPKPDLVFLIDLDEHVAFRRKDDIPSIDYLREIRKTYLNIGEMEDMIIVDGNMELDEVNMIVAKHFENWWASHEKP